MTQTLILHVIRTNKIPILQGLPSVPLILTSVMIMLCGMWLPHSPLAPSLGFTELPLLYWPLLLLTLGCYVALTQSVKMVLFRKGWICVPFAGRRERASGPHAAI